LAQAVLVRLRLLLLSMEAQVVILCLERLQQHLAVVLVQVQTHQMADQAVRVAVAQ
jgi:hypothetical protein